MFCCCCCCQKCHSVSRTRAHTYILGRLPNALNKLIQVNVQLSGRNSTLPMHSYRSAESANSAHLTNSAHSAHSNRCAYPASLAHWIKFSASNTFKLLYIVSESESLRKFCTSNAFRKFSNIFSGLHEFSALTILSQISAMSTLKKDNIQRFQCISIIPHIQRTQRIERIAQIYDSSEFDVLFRNSAYRAQSPHSAHQYQHLSAPALAFSTNRQMIQHIIRSFSMSLYLFLSLSLFYLPLH